MLSRSCFVRMGLLCLCAIILAGCSAKNPDFRVLWPPPPQTPKMEFLGVYYSERDLHKSDRDKLIASMIGGEQGLAFDFPFGIASDSQEKVYVSDSGKKQIHVVDFGKGRISRLGVSTAGAPMGITVDSNGNIYVVVAETKNVLVYSVDHKPLFNFGSDVFEKPTKVALDEERGKIYVTDIKKCTVEVFDLKGNHLSSFGSPGVGDGQLWKPTGLAVDDEGNIYIAENLNARISVFDINGEYLRSFGERRDNIGGFEMPKDIAIDSEGHLHIIDSRKAGILTYSKEGSLLLYTGFGKPTPDVLGFGMPTSIFIDKRDRIFVADLLNKRIAVWQYLNEDYLNRNPITDEDLEAYRSQEAF